MKNDKNEHAVTLGVDLVAGEEITADTVEELTNGKGADENE